jgi:hypothetical protein
VPVSKLIQEIKQDSSHWMKQQGAAYVDFAWQNGYSVFSIGQSQLADSQRYVANQREHHRRESFEDEFRRLLAKYEIEADERYVWD